VIARWRADLFRPSQFIQLNPYSTICQYPLNCPSTKSESDSAVVNGLIVNITVGSPYRSTRRTSRIKRGMQLRWLMDDSLVLTFWRALLKVGSPFLIGPSARSLSHVTCAATISTPTITIEKVCERIIDIPRRCDTLVKTCES